MSKTLFESLDIGALVPSIGVFGGVRRFIEIGNELVRRGHRYVLYHPTGEQPDWLPFKGETKPLSALDDSRHQVLICNDPPLLDRFEKARADVKLFYFALENIKNERSIAGHSGWHILANSTGLCRRLRRKYRITVHPVIGGINLDTFKPRPEGLLTSAMQDKIKGERKDDFFRVLTFGRLSRSKKGVPIVLAAVKSFARTVGGGLTGSARARPVKLVLFDSLGSWNDRDPRDEIARMTGSLPHEFHLNPSQTELAALYSSCDLFVSAEKRAGWANTVAEAMACGLPVVCTRSGAVDIAAHRDTAWVVRWRHRFFVQRGLRALHEDPGLARTLSGNALERIRRYSWPHVGDQLEDVIRRSLGANA
jgi:glycosyltransferase involved in cell wall biosynthesis